MPANITGHLLRMGTRDNKDYSWNNVEIIVMNIESSIYLESLFAEVTQPFASSEKPYVIGDEHTN